MVIRQKHKSQNGCYKKTKQAKFSEKWTFLTPDPHTCVCISGGKKCSFFGKFRVLCFLVTPILRFALFPYCWRIIVNINHCTKLVWPQTPTFWINLHKHRPSGCIIVTILKPNAGTTKLRKVKQKNMYKDTT